MHIVHYVINDILFHTNRIWQNIANTQIINTLSASEWHFQWHPFLGVFAQKAEDCFKKSPTCTLAYFLKLLSKKRFFITFYPSYLTNVYKLNAST